jgi:tripartite-type tricarboxylate transporter receptor subunit TctC
MAQAVGQPIIVTNRSGAAGNPAARFVAHAPPDGETLLLGNNGLLAANPLLFADIGYDPLVDFAPISLIGLQPSVLVVSPMLGADNLEALIALARAGALATAVSGQGSAAHLAAELFKARTGTGLREASYDGAAPALKDLAVGAVDMMFATASSVLDHIRAGTVRALAVTSARRSPRLPDVATMAELGIDGFDVTSWHGLVAPAGTDATIVARLHRAIVEALRDEGVQKTFAALAIDAAGNSPSEFRAHIAAEIPQWARLMRESGTSQRRAG